MKRTVYPSVRTVKGVPQLSANDKECQQRGQRFSCLWMALSPLVLLIVWLLIVLLGCVLTL